MYLLINMPLSLSVCLLCFPCLPPCPFLFTGTGNAVDYKQFVAFVTEGRDGGGLNPASSVLQAGGPAAGRFRKFLHKAKDAGISFQRAFETFDVDQSGCVGFSAFQKGLSKITNEFLKVSDTECRALFRLLDLVGGGKGHVNVHDFVAFLTRSSQLEEARQQDAERRRSRKKGTRTIYLLSALLSISLSKPISTSTDPLNPHSISRSSTCLLVPFCFQARNQERKRPS